MYQVEVTPLDDVNYNEEFEDCEVLQGSVIAPVLLKIYSPYFLAKLERSY